VLTYNVQFQIPWNFAGFDRIAAQSEHYWPNVAKRAEAIGQAMACYDLVALNETMNDVRRHQIWQAMEDAAAACDQDPLLPGGRYFVMVDGPDVPDDEVLTFSDGFDLLAGRPIIGDEVAIISRFPIVETHQHIYHARAPRSLWAGHGVLHARLERGGQLPMADQIDVFVTHLATARTLEVQRRQIEELTAFIKQYRDPEIPLLLMGDFNLRGLSDAQADPNSEYARLMGFLDAELGLVDIGRHLGGTNHDDNPAQHRKVRIDYIFLSRGGLAATESDVRIQEFPDRRWGTLSDHAAVEARLTWQP
jgi:endonuclease/exonuclease/phosphatase family metal-dependent hydrolase